MAQISNTLSSTTKKATHWIRLIVYKTEEIHPTKQEAVAEVCNFVQLNEHLKHDASTICIQQTVAACRKHVLK